MRNFLALAQALGHRATVEGRTAEDFRNDYMARLRNLIRSSELGFGGDCPTDLTGLIEAILSPYSVPGAIKIAGPRHVGLRGEVLAALGLVLHEAATNAAKYGALSVPNGQIRVTYNIDQQGLLQIHWTERGGPPASTPKQVGFGSKLMTTTIKLNLGGTVAQHFGEEGLTLDITIPDALDLAPETE